MHIEEYLIHSHFLSEDVCSDNSVHSCNIAAVVMTSLTVERPNNRICVVCEILPLRMLMLE